MPTSQQNKPKDIRSGIRWSLGSALVAALGAALCCLAPLIYLLFGVSVAALSGLSRLSALQGPLSIIALSCLALVFHRLYLSRRLICTQTGSVHRLRILFWLSVLLILPLLTYPFVLAVVFA